MTNYIKKLIKKQKLLKQYKYTPEMISNLIGYVGWEVYEKHYLNQIFYESRCYKRLKKL